MRLVTDDPRVYITWVLVSILVVVAIIALAFLYAWLDVYVVKPFIRRRKKGKK